ncbi:MAG: hypothetical protein ABH816_02710 [Candidatus Levyibacteriota bacterium]
MKKPVFFLTFLILIAVSLTIVQIFVSNRISTTGLVLSNFEEEANNYERENSLLKEKLLTISSLNYIASQAGQLGFVEDKSKIFLVEPLPLARQ